VAGKQDTAADWNGHSTAGRADLSSHACCRNEALLPIVGMPSSDHAGFEMEVDERHHKPMGSLHGGICCDLADAAMGCP
jgi:acyl-coenzyme A thioesterase PaaI-like protein